MKLESKISQNHSVKTQENEMMKFLGGRRSGERKKNFDFKNFFFSEINFFQTLFSNRLPPKNFMISFFIPWVLTELLEREFGKPRLFFHPQRFVGKKVFFKISFPPEMKSQTPTKLASLPRHSSTNSSALISNFLSSSRSNQNIFHSSGWRMDFTFSRNSRDNRK